MAIIIPYQLTPSTTDGLRMLGSAQKRERKLQQTSVKTLALWQDSGIREFGDFCQPGDEVDEDLVNEFINCVPPATLRQDCIQCGEPFCYMPNSDGLYYAVYLTFHRNAGHYMFDGYCFRGNTENQLAHAGAIREKIEDLKAVIA